MKVWAAFFSLALLWSCSFDVAEGTVGSETTNGITGIVMKNDAPAEGARITLYPVEYNPVEPDSAHELIRVTTDAKGVFNFRNVLRGQYNIIAQLQKEELSILMGDVVMEDSAVELNPVELLANGRIIVSLLNFGVSEPGYLYIPGTDASLTVAPEDLESNTVHFENLPAGEYPEILYVAAESGESENLLSDTLRVQSGDSTVAGPWAGWIFSKALTLNTGPSGADISETLYGFPLLVRLTGDDFDFAGAASDGSDIRFSKPLGAPMAYEIERWDADAELAEIWVLIDTLLAGSNNQVINMHWGREQVEVTDHSGVVFDTANGFGFVYHLNENPANGVAPIKDRTYNGLDGVINGQMDAEDNIPGVVGLGYDFDGTDDAISPISPNPGFFHNTTSARSISVWVTLSENTAGRPLIYDEGGSVYGFILYYSAADGKINFATKGFSTDTVDIVSSTGDFSAETSPVYITATFLEGELNLYINGQLDSSFTAEYTEITYHQNEPSIGGTDETILSVGTRRWNGLMDEIRGATVARSADWVKMCYENQRPGSGVVEF